MRTTLTIDDDLAAQLKDRAQVSGVTFKEVVNRALRAGLGAPARSTARRPKVKPHRFGFRPGVDLDKLNQLVDQLDAEEFVKSSKTR